MPGVRQNDQGTLYHHEFLEQVTPEIFRGVALHPCCHVLPLLNKLRKNGPDRDAESKARLEVKTALKEFLDKKKEQEKSQRVPEAK